MTWLGYDEDAVARHARNNPLKLTTMEKLSMLMLGAYVMALVVSVGALVRMLMS